MDAFRQYETYDLRFHSGLVEWIKKLPMRTARINQWRATILNAKGMRQEEIEQSGILEMFLDNGAVKLDKAELLEYIEYNLRACYPSLITERARSYQPSLRYVPLNIKDIPEKILDSFNGFKVKEAALLPSFNFRLVCVRYNDMFDDVLRWLIFDQKWNLIKPLGHAGVFRSSLEAIDAMHTTVQKKFDRFTSSTPHKVYERYSLLGGRNYREWFLCIDKWIESYDNNHFGKDNLLVHIRTSEWLDKDGQPLLLVDEIQSDWHAAKKHADEMLEDGGELDESDIVPIAPFAREWHELGIKAACSIAINAGFNRVAFTTGEQHCKRYAYGYEGLKILYDQHVPKALEKLKQKYHCGVIWVTIAAKMPSEKMITTSGREWIVENNADKSQKIRVKNEQVALSYLKAKSAMKYESVRVLEISPILFQTIKTRGLPLFGW